MIFLNGRGKKMSKWPRRRNWGFGSGSTVRRIPVAGTVEGQQKHLHERWDTSAPAIEARTEQKRQPRSLDVSMEKKQSAIRSKAVVQVRVTRYQKLLGNAKSWKAAVLSHGNKYREAFKEEGLTRWKCKYGKSCKQCASHSAKPFWFSFYGTIVCFKRNVFMENFFICQTNLRSKCPN